MEDTKIVLITSEYAGDMQNMTLTSQVKTGANTGIGLKILKPCSSGIKSITSWSLPRGLEKAEKASKQTLSQVESRSSAEAFVVDVKSHESIKKANEQMTEEHSPNRLSCKQSRYDETNSHVALLFLPQPEGDSSDVNVTGAQIMSRTFLPLLLESSDLRLIFVTSGLLSVEGVSDPKNPGNVEFRPFLPKMQTLAGYGASKMGLNMMMLNWARSLKTE